MLKGVALTEGRKLLNEVGCTARLELDGAKVRAGAYHTHKNLITLSRHFVERNEWETVRNTLLHEAAHAFTPYHGHDAKWRAACRDLGIEPNRCYDGNEVDMPTPPIVLWCPTHGELHRQHRMPRRNARSYKVCAKCRTPIQYMREEVPA